MWKAFINFKDCTDAGATYGPKKIGVITPADAAPVLDNFDGL